MLLKGPYLAPLPALVFENLFQCHSLLTPQHAQDVPKCGGRYPTPFARMHLHQSPLYTGALVHICASSNALKTEAIEP